MLKMKVQAVGINVSSQAPVVLLQEENGEGVLPIVVGPAEAKAITIAREGIELPRPISYDLMNNIFSELAIDPERVIISDLRDNTFYARLEINQKGEKYSIDSRPSDAINIALRTETPIYLAEEVAHRALVRERPEEDEESISQEVENERERFRKFVDNVFDNVNPDL